MEISFIFSLPPHMKGAIKKLLIEGEKNILGNMDMFPKVEWLTKDHFKYSTCSGAGEWDFLFKGRSLEVSFKGARNSFKAGFLAGFGSLECPDPWSPSPCLIFKVGTVTLRGHAEIISFRSQSPYRDPWDKWREIAWDDLHKAGTPQVEGYDVVAYVPQEIRGDEEEIDRVIVDTGDREYLCRLMIDQGGHHFVSPIEPKALDPSLTDQAGFLVE